MGGGTVNAAINALSAPEYAQPTPELCGQCSPKYSQSRSTIPGVFWPNQGVWAGVKLPGGQYRKREQLAQAHEVLRQIAAGEINARELPENAALLARRENDREIVRANAVVLHLPATQRGPRSAA
ncbi:transcriptional regulator [Mycobacterium camsae]|uniref:transcriptional regulator n=1 Tax=Mycobacterium gordonae TaxID=1778 RepID=UPI003D6637B2